MAYANKLRNGMMWKTKVIAKAGERYFAGRLVAVTDKMDYIIEAGHGIAYFLRHDIADLVAIEEEEQNEN